MELTPEDAHSWELCPGSSFTNCWQLLEVRLLSPEMTCNFLTRSRNPASLSESCVPRSSHVRTKLATQQKARVASLPLPLAWLGFMDECWDRKNSDRPRLTNLALRVPLFPGKNLPKLIRLKPTHPALWLTPWQREDWGGGAAGPWDAVVQTLDFGFCPWQCCTALDCSESLPAVGPKQGSA